MIYEEKKKVLKDRWKMSFFVLIGMAFVVAITYANTFVGGGKDLSNPDIGMYIYAFFVGAMRSVPWFCRAFPVPRCC